MANVTQDQRDAALEAMMVADIVDANILEQLQWASTEEVDQGITVTSKFGLEATAKRLAYKLKRLIDMEPDQMLKKVPHRDLSETTLELIQEAKVRRKASAKLIRRRPEFIELKKELEYALKINRSVALDMSVSARESLRENRVCMVRDMNDYKTILDSGMSFNMVVIPASVKSLYALAEAINDGIPLNKLRLFLEKNDEDQRDAALLAMAEGCIVDASILEKLEWASTEEVEQGLSVISKFGIEASAERCAYELERLIDVEPDQLLRKMCLKDLSASTLELMQEAKTSRKSSANLIRRRPEFLHLNKELDYALNINRSIALDMSVSAREILRESRVCMLRDINDYKIVLDSGMSFNVVVIPASVNSLCVLARALADGIPLEKFRLFLERNDQETIAELQNLVKTEVKEWPR